MWLWVNQIPFLQNNSYSWKNYKWPVFVQTWETLWALGKLCSVISHDWWDLRSVITCYQMKGRLLKTCICPQFSINERSSMWPAGMATWLLILHNPMSTLGETMLTRELIRLHWGTYTNHTPRPVLATVNRFEWTEYTFLRILKTRNITVKFWGVIEENLQFPHLESGCHERLMLRTCSPEEQQIL